MGFNLVLYAVIIFGLLVGKSYDYQPKGENDSTTTSNTSNNSISNNTNNK